MNKLIYTPYDMCTSYLILYKGGNVSVKEVSSYDIRRVDEISDSMWAEYKDLVREGKLEFWNPFNKKVVIVFGRTPEGVNKVLELGKAGPGIEEKTDRELLEMGTRVKVVRECVNYEEGELGEKIASIGRQYGSILESVAAREELYRRTGIAVVVTLDRKTTKKTYEICLNGVEIDRLDLRGETGKNIKVVVVGGVVKELELCSNISIDTSVMYKVYQEDEMSSTQEEDRTRIGKLIVRVDREFLDLGGVEVDSLLLARGSKVVKIKGFKGNYLDVRGAKDLKVLEECCNFNEDESKLVQWDLDKEREIKVSESFNNVKLESKIDLTGFRHIYKSFNGISGVSRIEGRVKGSITKSFKTDKFYGEFDISTGTVLKSFKYSSKDTITGARGRIRLCKELQAEQEYVLGITDSSVDEEHPESCWKQDVTVEGKGVIKEVTLECTPNRRISVVKGVEIALLRVINDSKVPVESIPVLEGSVEKLIEGTKPYRNVKVYSNTSFAVNDTQEGSVSIKEYEDIWVLDEGKLEEIEEGCMSGFMYGPRYLVIPRSCKRVGSRALLDVSTNTGIATTICVYKGSAVHKQLKNRKMVLKVIDDLGEVTSLCGAELEENDVIYSLLDSGTQNVSLDTKVFEGKLVLQGKYSIKDMYDLETKPDLSEKCRDILGRASSEGVDYSGCIAERPGEMCKVLRGILLIENIEPSNYELLRPEILDKFDWVQSSTVGWSYYVGIPKLGEGGFKVGGIEGTRLQLCTYGGKIVYIGAIDTTKYNVLGGVLKDSVNLNSTLVSLEGVTWNDPITPYYINKLKLNIKTDEIRIEDEIVSRDSIEVFSKYRRLNWVGLHSVGTDKLRQTRNRRRNKGATRVYYDIYKNIIYEFISSNRHSGMYVLYSIETVEEWRKKEASYFRNKAKIEKKYIDEA